MSLTHHTIETTFRQEYGRVLAALISYLGDFALAEDAVQDALVVALEQWPQKGIPRNAAAWLTTTARHKAIDRLRRAKIQADKLPLLLEDEDSDSETMDSYPDERLKLIFTCCHPALTPEAQVALTLRTLGGLTTEEIAAAFLIPTPTLAQRLVRAQRKIKTAGIPYRVPPAHLLGERLEAVLTVIYLIFNEGYRASQGHDLIRQDLCAEAIRLGTLLNQLLADEPTQANLAEAMGLLALMLLHHTRRDARLSPAGALLTLEEQDRSLWHQAEIEAGIMLLDKAMARRQPGPYQIQAAIAALHAQAPTPETTDWPQIAALYGALIRLHPTAIVELNRAVAVAMAEGPLAGLRLLETLEQRGELDNYYLFHAARADLLRRAGWWGDAAAAYQRALSLTHNTIEQTFLRQRLVECEKQLNSRL
jgi:RNA polymerase sigma-70 factor (ECF subfamily)